MTLGLNRLIVLMASVLCMTLAGCGVKSPPTVQLSHGVDESAGGDPAYIITTPSAVYYLEKSGGGLSSMLDREGVDWLGFHKAPGSGHKGEYRGFPNAVHRQDGNYFHAMNAGTDASTSTVDIESEDHVRIVVTSGNGEWEGHYDFYPDRLDFTMSKVSPGYKYWVQYEGVPGGEMDRTDFWYSSASPKKTEDDNHPDNYVSRPDMTVLGFGRKNKDKFLTTPQTFSIGFVESINYDDVSAAIEALTK